MKVQNFIDSRELKEDISFSPNNLDDAMMNQASLLVHYGILSAKASLQVDKLKMYLQTMEAKVYREVKDKLTDKGEKITENQLNAAIATDSRIIVAKKALNEAKQIESVAKTAVEAFRHRRDMLIQQGLLSREEMKGEVSIAKRNNEAERAEQFKRRLLEKGNEDGDYE